MVQSKEDAIEVFERCLFGRPNTIKTQRAIFKKQIAPYVKEIDSIGGIQNFIPILIKKWQDQDLKASTMNVYMSVAAKYIEGMTGHQPNLRRYRGILKRQDMPDRVKAWTKEEAKKALDICKRDQTELYLPLLLTLHTGMRVGELLGLEWDDIDLFEGSITVKRSFDGPTKNGKYRVIPISDKLALTLQDYYKPGTTGKVCWSGDMNYHLAKLCKLADVPKLSWHGLRHSFATLALENGTSPRVVQDLMGHTTLTTTLNLYWNLTKDTVDLGFLP